MRLNKYVAHTGLCSRRKAAEIIKNGKIKVNGITETNPAVEVSEKDQIEYKGRPLLLEKNMIYLLLNKPKAVITSLSDDKGRKTIADLLGRDIEERVYPVGRLDYNTTGLLLITNDGELANKLTHPSYEVKKVYEVELDQPLSIQHFQMIKEGLELEDGPIKVDAISIAGNEKTVGIELHSGRNRIVRRIFEHLGYSVVRLDRMRFADLTKKNLPRGKYRHLTKKEIIFLKHFGK
jgi:23S rRNA pseudouridine2605 synthase